MTCRGLPRMTVAVDIELRQIDSIRHLLTAQTTQTLVCAFILSRLDYCNCILAGCQQFLIDRLQKVQNSAARLICRAKKQQQAWPCPTHSSVLTLATNQGTNTLHTFQALLHVIKGTGPQYLSEPLHLCTPSRDLRSSADTRILETPRSNSKSLGQRSFSHVGPSTWNDLPYSLRHLWLWNHLDRLGKPISFNKVSNLLPFFLWRIFLCANVLPRARACVRACVCVWVCVCVCVCVRARARVCFIGKWFAVVSA